MDFSKTTDNILYKTDGIVNIFDGYRDKWEDFYPSERWAFEKLAGNSGGLGKVLDVGCAIGGLGRTLSKRYRIESYAGVDINTQAIDVAKQNQSQISVPAEFSSGDILELNILDGKTFDTVFSLSCADWNIETDLIIYRCWDFVKPGGVFVISLRLTSQESINDMKRSYQPFAFDDEGNVVETANYVIYNYAVFFRLIKNLRPPVSSVMGYGYWGQPASNAVTPYKDLVFGVLIVSKALDGQLAKIESELYFPLDLFT